MTAVAVSSQARKTRPGRRAAPSPQARGVNLSSAPWRGRQEPLPARSGAAQAGGEDRGRTRSVSAREPAGKGRRNWARRAAARPRASCGSGSSKGGGAAAPPGVLRTTKVAWQSGQEAQNGRDESSRRPPPASTWKTLKAPQPPPPARPRARPARADRPSACGVPGGRALPAATPPRSLGSRPPNGEHSATPLCFRGTHDVPATPQGQRRPSSQSAGTEKSADRREGQRAPPATGEWKSAGRGAQLQSGDPRAHRGELCGAKFKVPLRNALPPRRCAASPGGQRSAESQDWRAGREAGGRVGGVPRARQAAAAPGKVVSAERGVAPRAGAAQVQLGRAGASAKSPGAKRQPGGREGGSPSGRGRGWGRRAERRWSNGEVLTGPRAKLRAARKSRGRAEP